MNTLNRTYLWWLIVAGLIEGTSTLLLFFVAMPLKYAAGMPQVVTVVGGIHGVLFIGLVAMFVIGRWVVPLSWGLVGIGFIAAIVPFGPFLVDIKLVRMLRASEARAADDATTRPAQA
ncbi:MAG: DUF3817 domain-containing protein [Phycisphaerales bacterium]|nr:DUF3817 domain-containing protein [Phycisphaerales bacterium]